MQKLNLKNYNLCRNEYFCKGIQVRKVVAAAEVNDRLLLQKMSKCFSCNLLRCFESFAAGQHVEMVLSQAYMYYYSIGLNRLLQHIQYNRLIMHGQVKTATEFRCLCSTPEKESLFLVVFVYERLPCLHISCHRRHLSNTNSYPI